VADIKPPDYETRVAILRKKAADDALTLDFDVIDFIARSCTSSVRELEGAVIKLLAYSSLKRQDITVAMAERALQGVFTHGLAEPPNVISPERVRKAVAEVWGVEPGALSSKRRTRDLTVPRQVAMYLIREILDLPLMRIGGLFGGRDHSTVIHSIRKVEHMLTRDPTLRRQIEKLRAELTAARGD
jgi:chromosomal replication initiator protein